MAETYPTTPGGGGGGGGGAGAPNPVHVPPLEQPHTHERTDIATRPLWIFFGAFIIITVVTHVALYVLFFAYQRSEMDLDEERVRSLVKQVNPGPPEPRLQGIPGYNVRTPRQDLELMRAQDRRRLTTYAPAQDGSARIPIDRAIDLLLQQGLPMQRQPATQPSNRGGADAR